MFQLTNKENLIQFRMSGFYKLESLSCIAKLHNDINKLLPVDIVARIGEYSDETYESMYDEIHTKNYLQARTWSHVDSSFNVDNSLIRCFNINHYVWSSFEGATF